MKKITIPNSPSGTVHGVPTTPAVLLDKDGNCVKKIEKPSGKEIEVTEQVNEIKVLDDRSKLKNYSIHPEYSGQYDSVTISLSDIKNRKISEIKRRAKLVLSETDWYIIRNKETGEAIPQEVLNHRSQVRSDSDTFEQEVKDLTTVEEVLNYDYNFPEPPEP